MPLFRGHRLDLFIGQPYAGHAAWSHSCPENPQQTSGECRPWQDRGTCRRFGSTEATEIQPLRIRTDLPHGTLGQFTTEPAVMFSAVAVRARA